MQENDKGEETRQKLKMAQEFIQRKINLYLVTLTIFIQTKTYPTITQETLTIYLQKAQELKEWVEKNLKEKEEEE